MAGFFLEFGLTTSTALITVTIFTSIIMTAN
jgi:hypothetical protein